MRPRATFKRHLAIFRGCLATFQRCLVTFKRCLATFKRCLSTFSNFKPYFPILKKSADRRTDRRTDGQTLLCDPFIRQQVLTAQEENRISVTI